MCVGGGGASDVARLATDLPPPFTSTRWPTSTLTCMGELWAQMAVKLMMLEKGAWVLGGEGVMCLYL